jgi:hypothetical protein
MNVKAWISLSLIAATIVSASARADTYSENERRAYVQGALEALQQTPRSALDNLQQFVRILERNSCRGGYGAMTISCLQEEARRNCEATHKRHCPVLSDIAVVNKLNEKQFVTREELFRSARQSSGPGSAQLRLLNRKYALLTTEFLLLAHGACQTSECLARELDGYCLQNADVKNLSWQACVGAAAWFIGTSRKLADKGESGNAKKTP